MPRKRFTAEQIIGVLKEAEAGLAVDELCRHDPLDRNFAELSKKQYARFTLATLTEEFGEQLHPAFRDLTQRVGCCFGQCDDGGDGGG